MNKSKSFVIKLIVNFFIILLFFSIGNYYQDQIIFSIKDLIRLYEPCQQPITYSLGDIDPRFQISNQELLINIGQAEVIWESAIDKDLFSYAKTGETGDLRINLIYDYRQKATDDLKKIGVVINDDQAGYNELKIKYDALIADYEQQKIYLDTLASKYEIMKKTFEKDIDIWNNKKGSSNSEYNSLEQRRLNLNKQVELINREQDSLNALANNINSTKIILNKLIAELNLQVTTYNTVGDATGQEFDQGEYIRDSNNIFINIFQFNDEPKLVRVLAHEFGHVLGLDHLNNPQAMMYYLNEGVNKQLTIDDVIALKSKCGIK